MSQCIESTKKASECKQWHPMTMDHQREGTYISNQVRIYAYHLTKSCIDFDDGSSKSYRKILNEVKDDFFFSLFTVWVLDWKAATHQLFGYSRLDALLSIQFIWLISIVLIYEQFKCSKCKVFFNQYYQ